MKKKFQFKHLEAGQVIPILVVGILVTVMMAAVLVDGGMLLSHRRSAQAAADAGALAGVKHRCPGNGGTEAEAETIAEEYVSMNNAEVIDIQFPDDHTIRVEARTESQAFFAGIFDQVGLAANAVAEANCTVTAGAGGAVLQIPIAVPCKDRQIENGQIISCSNTNLNQEQYIIKTNVRNREYCKGYGYSRDANIECSNGLNNASSRGWLNLTGTDSDDWQKLIDCWMGGVCENENLIPSFIDQTTWLSTVNGARPPSDYDFDKYKDQDFYVGIYDKQTRFPPNNHTCSADNVTCILHPGQGHNAYRIVGYARFTITTILNTEIRGEFTEGPFFFGSDGGDGSSQFIVQLTQ